MGPKIKMFEKSKIQEFRWMNTKHGSVICYLMYYLYFKITNSPEKGRSPPTPC